MTALLWGVRQSLLDYVRSMPDGRIELSDGAADAGTGAFLFPSTGPGDSGQALRFGGRLTLTGHQGMMRVVIAEPWILPRDSGWELTIADDQESTGRLAFATVVAFFEEGGTRRGAGTLLTESGADLFFGPYAAGTTLDDPVVLP